MIRFLQEKFHDLHEVCVVVHVCWVLIEFAHKAHVL